MRPFILLLILIAFILLNQGCYSLYKTKTIDIEVIVPGKVKLADDYKTVAIRYNNCNVAPNPYFQKSIYIDTTTIEEENIDSIASKLYFNYFVDEIKKQDFFDSVLEITEQDFSQIVVIDTINYENVEKLDSIISNVEYQKYKVYLFSNVINEFPNKEKTNSFKRYLHSTYGLYQPNEIQDIADSSKADLFISLDYFSAFDKTLYDKSSFKATESVIINGCWNFYDLKKQEFIFSFQKKDTISWKSYITYSRNIKRFLPPRRDAILNAADISGEKFANILIPHWKTVQRMYYRSGHIELKKTDQLVEEGK